MGRINFWKDKRVFVAGGSGFIGSHLTKALLNRGADVKILAHVNEPIVRDTVGVWGDVVTSANHIFGFLRLFQPEIIFYLVAQPIVGIAGHAPLHTLETNVRGSYKFLNYCTELQQLKSFVYISTDKVYGKEELIRDGSPLLGMGHPYNASKVMGDVVAQLYGSFYRLPVSVIRNANIYGPRDLHFDRIIPRTLFRVYNDMAPEVRGGINESKRDYIYVDDIVDGLMKSAVYTYLHGGLEIFNFGANEPLSALDVVTRILKFCGKKDFPVMRNDLWEGELVNQHFESNARTKEMLGWEPFTSFDDGLVRTINWYMDYFEGKRCEI